VPFFRAFWRKYGTELATKKFLEKSLIFQHSLILKSKPRAAADDVDQAVGDDHRMSEPLKDVRIRCPVKPEVVNGLVVRNRR
jgi:hypothetical protein